MGGNRVVMPSDRQVQKSELILDVFRVRIHGRGALEDAQRFLPTIQGMSQQKAKAKIGFNLLWVLFNQLVQGAGGAGSFSGRDGVPRFDVKPLFVRQSVRELKCFLEVRLGLVRFVVPYYRVDVA